MSVLSIIQTVVLILDILFFVVLGLNLLIGFAKGWRKSLLNIIAFLVPFLIIIIFRGTISKAILQINISGDGTILEMIVETLRSTLYEAEAQTPELIQLCESLGVAVINLGVYIAGLIVALLLSFILKIIFGLTLKKFIYAPTDGVKSAPTLKTRLFGLIPGFCHFLVAMILLFFPLAGIINVCNMAVTDISYIEPFFSSDDSIKTSSTNDILDEVNQGLDESVFSKILNFGQSKKSGVSWASSYTGSLFAIKTENAKVNIIDEYGRIRQVIPVVANVANSISDSQIVSLNVQTDDLNKISNAIKNTEILKLVAPVTREFLVHEVSKDESNKEIVSKIESLNLVKELDVMTDILVEVVNTCKDVEINLDHVEDILLTPSLATHINTIMDKTFESDIINYIAMPYAIDYINESIPEEYADIKNILTEENIKNCLQTDVANLLVVYQNLSEHNNLHNYIFNNGEIDLSSENALNNIETTVVDLFSISLITGNEETLIKLALDAANVEGLTYDALFDGVNANWEEEVKVLAKTAKAAVQVANVLDILNAEENESLDLLKLIEKDENGQYVLEVLLNEISNSELFKKVILNFIYSMEFDEQTQRIIDIIDLSKIEALQPDDFKEEFRRLLQIVDTLFEANLFSEEPIHFTKDSIKTLADNVFASVFIVGRESDIIEFILDFMAFEGYTYDSVFGDYVPNWELEKQVVSNILYDVMDVIETNQLTDNFSVESIILRDESGEYIFRPLISDISKSELLKNVLINLIDNLELDSEIQEVLDLFDIKGIKDFTSEEFENEFIRLLDIVEIVSEMNLIGEGDILISEDSIESLISTIFESEFIQGNESDIIDYIIDMTGFKETLEDIGVELNYSDIDWDQEADNIIDIFNAVLSFGDLESFDFESLLDVTDDATTDQVVELVDAIGSSQIFSGVLFDIIETMVAAVGYEVTFTEEDKEKILANTWEQEITNLLDLVDFCTEKLGETADYNTISGDEIAEIMTKASTTVVATKILGGVLNEMLGQDYLAINPILSDGSYKYDFTNPDTLASTAIDIGALIDLKNNATNLDMSDISKATENVDNIIESIIILDESGLAKDMIQEVIGTDSGINLDEISLAEEAKTIQKIYDVYKEDYENFDINEHPELKEELENSDFAKTILEMLGISKEE